ncbi:hypothetical protein ACTAQJ_07345 [Arthrobacter sp. alpha11c]
MFHVVQEQLARTYAATQGPCGAGKRALAHEGIETSEQLAEFGEQKASKLHGMGPVAIAQLEEAMEESGITFGSR